jgi:hypothetical protein
MDAMVKKAPEIEDKQTKAATSSRVWDRASSTQKQVALHMSETSSIEEIIGRQLQYYESYFPHIFAGAKNTLISDLKNQPKPTCLVNLSPISHVCIPSWNFFGSTYAEAVQVIYKKIAELGIPVKDIQEVTQNITRSWPIPSQKWFYYSVLARDISTLAYYIGPQRMGLYEFGIVMLGSIPIQIGEHKTLDQAGWNMPFQLNLKILPGSIEFGLWKDIP